MSTYKTKATWIESGNIKGTCQPGFHPIIAKRLFNLGLQSDQQIKAFLDPDFFEPAQAEELPGLIGVADRIEKAIHDKQSVCVWGDFDVDGQTSTAILVSTLKKIGGDVTYHVPIRGPETHGINIPVLKEIIDKGAQLILTCDTGITAHDAVNYANTRNVDVLITDHHDLPQEMPLAAGITNPKFLSSNHPLADLAGVGVAFKLTEELFKRFGMDPKEVPVELAALGLVADLAILKGDTRFLVQQGLYSLRNTKIMGLDILMNSSELDRNHLTEEHISFNIAPRLNSLGRLSDANMGVELLTTTDPVRAKVIISILEGMAAKSKLLSNQVFGAAEAQLMEKPSLLEQPIVILSHSTWPAGVLGIVASRLVERFGRPFILFSKPEGEPARGSARSTEGLNIHEAISAHKELLIQSGGHPMAAGMAIIGENIERFQERLNESIRSNEIDYSIEKTLQIDGTLTLDEITLELAEKLEIMAPYGRGNEKPNVRLKNVSIHDMVKVGRYKDHLKFLVRDGKGNSQTVLWWNAGDRTLPDMKIDLAANISASDWKGQKQVQLIFVDLQPSKTIEIEATTSIIEIIDNRDDEEPLDILRELPSESVIWLEGRDKKFLTEKIKKINPNFRIVDRNGLTPTEVLVICTIPPSHDVLKQILEVTKPAKIHLLKDVGEPITPESFIKHLMGLIKYTIEHQDGITTYQNLAAATAQNSITIKHAISWLVSKGKIQQISETEDKIYLTSGGFHQDPQFAEKQWGETRQLLEETFAYRSYFSRADKDLVLQI